MKITDLSKARASRVLGIDCSTYSLGFSVWENRKPVHCGEIMFGGAGLFERLNWIHERVPALVDNGLLKADYVGFEGAWLGPNPKTGLMLAYVYGAVIGALGQKGQEVVTIAPVTWQSYIGNPNLKKAEKDELKKNNPGKSASWYQSAGREMRKQRTLAFSRQYFPIESGSDNVGDAVAIGYYTAHKLVTG